MQEMIKQEDGTWTHSASTPNADVNVDLPHGNAPIEDKPRRKSREKKAKQ